MTSDQDNRAASLVDDVEATQAALEATATAVGRLAAAMASHDGKQLPFSTRLRASTLAAIEARARSEGTSPKLVICRALAAAGVEGAAADLEDGTPRRRHAA